MTMVFNDEQSMLQESAAEFFSSQLGVGTFRQARDESGVVMVNGARWSSMVDLGWSAILVPEELNGLGFGVKGLGAIVIEAGRNLAATHLNNTSGLGVTALLACEQTEQRDKLLSGIVTGDVITSCEIEPSAHVKEPPAYDKKPPMSLVAEGSTATHLLVIKEAGVAVFDLANIDRPETRGLIDHRDYVSFDFSELEAAFSLQFAQDNAKSKAETIGALLTAAELFGLSSEAFERTLAYLKEREQFGQKIGCFQALQHRMAHAYMELQMFKSVLLDALDAVEEQRQDSLLSVSHAKLLANDVSQLICTEAIQMHGGMGITDELDIGLFYKRARVQRSTYGSSAWHKLHCAELSGF